MIITHIASLEMHFSLKKAAHDFEAPMSSYGCSTTTAQSCEIYQHILESILAEFKGIFVKFHKYFYHHFTYIEVLEALFATKEEARNAKSPKSIHGSSTTIIQSCISNIIGLEVNLEMMNSLVLDKATCDST